MPRRQTPDIYQERLQTIMKIAGGQKDEEARWWELRSVMDDYEWQDMQELFPEAADGKQLQTTPSEHGTTSGGMTGDSSSSSTTGNAAKRPLTAKQMQMIEKKTRRCSTEKTKGATGMAVG